MRREWTMAMLLSRIASNASALTLEGALYLAIVLALDVTEC